MTHTMDIAHINGVALNPSRQDITPETLRQRACTELLRQAAIQAGLLDAADAAPSDGVISEAASQAIDAWLERELQLPDPSDEACVRHHAAVAAKPSSMEYAGVQPVRSRKREASTSSESRSRSAAVRRPNSAAPARIKGRGK